LLEEVSAPPLIWFLRTAFVCAENPTLEHPEGNEKALIRCFLEEFLHFLSPQLRAVIIDESKGRMNRNGIGGLGIGNLEM
jgi:hypothetical protein